MKLSWIDDMMTRDDKQSKILKLLKIIQKRLNMVSKGVLHHLAKFQISWLSFRVILGNFQKSKLSMLVKQFVQIHCHHDVITCHDVINP